MLNLDDLVSVTVSLSGLPAAREGFGAACLAGASGKLPSGTRTRVYSSAAALLDDGFTAGSPEYKAALAYFAQSPRPARLVVAAKPPPKPGPRASRPAPPIPPRGICSAPAPRSPRTRPSPSPQPPRPPPAPV